jgi:hypothetical protein
MLTVHDLEPADAALLFPDGLADIGRGRWEAGCAAGKYRVFAAERDEDPAGFAVAESGPSRLVALALEGGGGASRLLLERLVRAAGERDVGVWCPAVRAGLRALLLRRGFACVGRSEVAYLYLLSRNGGV